MTEYCTYDTNCLAFMLKEKFKEENEQLKQQIEKMKCCSNCNGRFLSSRCGLCINKNKWELEE